MKKLLVLIMCLLTLASAASCGQNKKANGADTSAAAENNNGGDVAVRTNTFTAEECAENALSAASSGDYEKMSESYYGGSDLTICKIKCYLLSLNRDEYDMIMKNQGTTDLDEAAKNTSTSGAGLYPGPASITAVTLGDKYSEDDLRKAVSEYNKSLDSLTEGVDAFDEARESEAEKVKSELDNFYLSAENVSEVCEATVGYTVSGTEYKCVYVLANIGEGWYVLSESSAAGDPDGYNRINDYPEQELPVADWNPEGGEENEVDWNW